MAGSGTKESEKESEEEQHSDREETKPPPFAKGWKWPLIFFVVGLIAFTVLLTLITSPTVMAPPPPPPPPPPPGLVLPLG